MALKHLRVLQVPRHPGVWAGAATQQCGREMDAVRFAPFRVFRQIVHRQFHLAVEPGLHLTDVPQRRRGMHGRVAHFEPHSTPIESGKQ